MFRGEDDERGGCCVWLVHFYLCALASEEPGHCDAVYLSSCRLTFEACHFRIVRIPNHRCYPLSAGVSLQKENINVEAPFYYLANLLHKSYNKEIRGIAALL